jgi:glycosyltransferase involved in cell wall biosynthesis
MKLVIATGLFPPEIGGPSQYAYRLSEEFKRMGHTVAVVRYGALKRFPSGVRHILYAMKLFYAARGAEAVFAFDTYSVGFPAAMVCRMRGIPLIIRIGGDFLWEGYVNRTNDLVPLPDFYKKAAQWNRKERMIYAQTRWTLAHARLAFNTAWLRDIWAQQYTLNPDMLAVIENECEPCRGGRAPEKKNYLFYSRYSRLKNHEAFRRAFARAQEHVPDIELSEGQVPHDALLALIERCYAVVVPSISDVAPNYVLDAIRFGKPFLLTKYSGYAERFKELGVIVDPLDEADMARGVEELARDETYAQLSARIRDFKESHSYADIAREFLSLI